MNDQLTYHESFSPEQLEQQYNLRLGRPDFEETIISNWVAKSEKVRSILNGTIDFRYGAGENQKLDVFVGQNSKAPTLVYFHGGYWKSGDKSIYSFLAEPFVEAGVNVVVVGYDLCPNVTLTRIVEESREAMAAIYNKASVLGISTEQITVMGHSAGGHITEMLMGTDWKAYSYELPADLIKAGIPVSPLSLLEPVRLTEGLNVGIGMDKKEAELQSPMLNHHPATDAPQMVVVGGAETDEFHRQAKMYVDAFGSSSRPIELYVVPEVDHFDELNVLADPESLFFKKALALIEA